MLAGIREITIVVNPRDLDSYVGLLGSGEGFGLQFDFVVQDAPLGIADGLLAAESSVGDERFAVSLGDNIFYGSGFGLILREAAIRNGATAFCTKVSDPSQYGVLELSKNGDPSRVVEKPPSSNSNLAVTGLYFLDKYAFKVAKDLSPSARGELEIGDILNRYLDQGRMNFEVLPRGMFWMDAGTIDSMSKASEFVRILEARQGLLVCSPEEIAMRLGWLSRGEIQNRLSQESSSYFKALLEVSAGDND